MHGILWMLFSTMWMASMHAAVRHVSDRLHPFEIAFFASLFGMLVVLPSFARSGMALLRTGRLAMHGVRAVFHVISMLAYFYALGVAPLALVTALAFTGPVFAIALAVPMFGERINGVRWLALLIGFTGILVVLRPGFAEMDTGGLVALFAAMFFSGVLVVTKSLSRTESSLTITAYMLLLMVPMSLIPALFVWQWPDGETFLWLVFIGVSSATGRLFLAQALKKAPVHVVMPVDFCRLIWVTGLGFFIFGDAPDPFSWAGGAMILGSAAAVAYWERRIAKQDST
ncbi:MAG: DMT family transporter [Rhodospirillales bacterium]|nr:DMT family transporter [Rhodospirillales bacterium]